MSQAASPSTGRRYGLARVCRVWQVPRSTVNSSPTRTRRLPGVRCMITINSVSNKPEAVHAFARGFFLDCRVLGRLNPAMGFWEMRR